MEDKLTDKLDRAINVTEVTRKQSSTSTVTGVMMANQILIMEALKELLEEKNKPNSGLA